MSYSPNDPQSDPSSDIGAGCSASSDQREAIDDDDEVARYTSWRQDSNGHSLAHSQFQVSGMFCVACAGTIEAALRASPGVVDATVNASSTRAEVVWQPGLTLPSRVVAAIQAAGYDAAPDFAAPAQALRKRESRQALWRLFVAGFCMMQVMMYATPAYVAAPGELPADQLRLLNWAGWLLSLPVLLFSAGPLFSSALRSVRARRIGMDVPVVLGLLIAFVASSGATFDPGGIFGHEVYFDSVTMFVFLLLGARTLELRARHQAASALEATALQLPDLVERLDVAGTSEMVNSRRLRPGDRVRVPVGQVFPADGRVIEGSTRADESMLSGESVALAKASGDEVLAGSVNLRAPVVFEVERVGADTRHEAIVALMRGAATERPEAVRAVDRLAVPFLWGVLLLATSAAVVWSLIDPSRVIWVAVSVLIVTCPCALSLATPSVLLAAGGALNRLGLLPRRLSALEQLARVDTIVFDKTGTLTEDRLSVVGSTLLDANGAQDRAMLHRQAASLAAWSTHPAARALVASAARAASDASAARAASDDEPASEWFDVEEHAGEGVLARDREGRWFRLGRATWVAAQPQLPGSASQTNESHKAERLEETTGTVCFGPAGAPVISFELAESLRADAVDAVRQLQCSGLSLMIASGDHPVRVAALAARLGIAEASGGLRPADKLALLESLQSKGHRVLMIGDGLNDAPVLARADVSIALGHGSQLSRLQADAVLLSPRLGVIHEARQIALRARRVIRQNLAWALLYNLVCIPLALLGFLPPWAAGAGMAGSSLLVVLNSLRAGRLPPGSNDRLHSSRGAIHEPRDPGIAWRSTAATSARFTGVSG